MQIRNERYKELIRCEMLLDHILSVIKSEKCGDATLKMETITWMIEVIRGDMQNERKN